MPISHSEMEIRVVTLLPPDFLWNPPSLSIEKVLLLMKMTDKPSQEKEETSKALSSTNVTEDDKFSLARKDEAGVSSTSKEEKAFHNPLTIVSREQWGSLRPRLDLPYHPIPFTLIYINHLAVNQPSYSAIKKLQFFSMIMDVDILNNFVVDSDGLVYEGRGWNTCLEGHIFHVDIIGNYNYRLPSQKKFAACRSIVKEGLRLGKISKYYQLFSITLARRYLETMMREMK